VQQYDPDLSDNQLCNKKQQNLTKYLKILKGFEEVINEIIESIEDENENQVENPNPSFELKKQFSSASKNNFSCPSGLKFINGACRKIYEF
jgi:uncharacterized protein YeeX (DUF496 family)